MQLLLDVMELRLERFKLMHSQAQPLMMLFLFRQRRFRCFESRFYHGCVL